MPRLSLADLGINAADDIGSTWHPRRNKTEARDGDGNLRNLDDSAVHEHLDKPEAAEQVDGIRRRMREGRRELAAEDSIETPDGEV